MICFTFPFFKLITTKFSSWFLPLPCLTHSFINNSQQPTTYPQWNFGLWPLVSTRSNTYLSHLSSFQHSKKVDFSANHFYEPSFEFYDINLLTEVKIYSHVPVLQFSWLLSGHLESINYHALNIFYLSSNQTKAFNFL